MGVVRNIMVYEGGWMSGWTGIGIDRKEWELGE